MGKDIITLLIPNFCESLTSHPPQNKFIAKKWVQNKIMKALYVNKLLTASKPR